MKKLILSLITLLLAAPVAAQDFRHRYFHYDQIYTDPSFLITANTIDGADTSYFSLCGGGGCGQSRGSDIDLWGNEAAGTGKIAYYAGNVVGGHHYFYTGNAYLRLTIPYLADADDADFLLGSASTTAPVFSIRPQTADGDDDASVIIMAGGGNSYTRGAYISMTGNETVGAGNQGSIYIRAGDDADGNIYFTTATNYTRLTIPYLADADDVELVLGAVSTTAPAFMIRGQTADGDDDGVLRLHAGGSTSVSGGRSAYLVLEGADSGGANQGGDVYLVGGVGASSTAGQYPIISIRNDTNDGSDWGEVNIGAGGSTTDTGRGAVLRLFGNENASSAGYARLSSNTTVQIASQGKNIKHTFDYGAGTDLNGVTCEAITIAAGSGAAGVTSGTNLCGSGIITGIGARITQAPGGGATTFDIGCTGSGNLDQFCDGVSTALNTTCTYPTNGDGTNTPWVQKAATTVTVTTDANVTGASMIIRVCPSFLVTAPPTS